MDATITVAIKMQNSTLNVIFGITSTLSSEILFPTLQIYFIFASVCNKF